ncbi:MAG: DUF2950 family protein, partial [Phycisphaerae bacterium]
KLATGDKVEDHRHFEEFLARTQQKFQLLKKVSTFIVLIGNEDCLFPIPIVRLPNDLMVTHY